MVAILRSNGDVIVELKAMVSSGKSQRGEREKSRQSFWANFVCSERVCDSQCGRNNESNSGPHEASWGMCIFLEYSSGFIKLTRLAKSPGQLIRSFINDLWLWSSWTFEKRLFQRACTRSLNFRLWNSLKGFLIRYWFGAGHDSQGKKVNSELQKFGRLNDRFRAKWAKWAAFIEHPGT